MPTFTLSLFYLDRLPAPLVQYNLSYPATPNVKAKWPDKTGGLSSQVEEKTKKF